MAGFSGCLQKEECCLCASFSFFGGQQSNDQLGDDTMAGSINVSSGNLEVLEVSAEDRSLEKKMEVDWSLKNEGKKKSKFKGFRNFFGKKKKKEPEDGQGRRSVKSSLSNISINSSSLSVVQEGQQPKSRGRMSLGNRSVSHDSIFMLEPELEISTSETYPSPESQRGRSLERSHTSRIVSSTGAVFADMPDYMSRSGIWVGGSRITEIPPLCARQPSISPPLVRSDTLSKDFEEFSVEDESPRMSRKKTLPQMLLAKMTSFEPSSGPVHSQSLTTVAMVTSPSSSQLPVAFSTPATTTGCLDSSAARHKMSLNPRKQKKNVQETVKPKQEEPSLTLVYEEENTTKPKATDQKKTKKESTGLLSQEQSSETEIYKTIDETEDTDATGSQDYLWPAGYRKQHGKNGSGASGNNEYGARGRSSPKPSGHRLSLGSTAESQLADKIFKDSPFRHLFLGREVMEYPIAPEEETSIHYELLSDKSDKRRRKAGLDFETRKALVSYPVPNDMKESMVSSQLQYDEDAASGTKNSEARASLLSVVKSPSTIQEGAMFSVAEEAQMCMDPSHIQPEEEDASSIDLPSVQLKMESSQDISTICKEKPPVNVLQGFRESILDMPSDLAEGGIPVERLSPRLLSGSLGELEDEKGSSDSDSISEVESDPEQQVAPGHFFQSSDKFEDEVLSDSESASEKSSGFEQQLDPKYSLQVLGMPKDDDQESFKESSSFVENLSSSHEQLAPRCGSQALGEPEDEVSTESNIYLEKYSNPKDWSSSEEDLPPIEPSLALEKPEDQKKFSSVSKNTDEKGASVEQILPRHLPQPFLRSFVPQHFSSDSMSASSEWVPMPPMHLSQPCLSSKYEQQASAGPESAALPWGISMEPLPPRMLSKHRMRCKVEQLSSLGPEVINIERITSMELQPSRNNSQPPVKPIAEQETSVGAESMAVEGSISMDPLPPKVFDQPSVRPKAEQKVLLGSEGAEKLISMEPPISEYCSQCLTKPQSQHIFIEDPNGDEGMFVELMPPKCACQRVVRPKFQPQTMTCSAANTAKEWTSPVEPMSSRHTLYFCVGTGFEQQASAGPESAAVERVIPMETLLSRMPSQPLMRPVAEQEASHPMNAPEDRNSPEEPVSPRYNSQNRMSPKFDHQGCAGPEIAVPETIPMEPLPPRMLSQPLRKQVVKPISASPESVATEGDTSTEPPPPRQWSIVRHKVQKMMPTVENAAVEGCISGRPLPIEYPAHFSVMSKVQEISPHLQNTATEGGMSKTPLLPRGPSKSFVKFMAQNVFSENPEKQVYVDPLISNQPSKSLLGPKVEQQVFSCWERGDIEGGISSKLPMKCPLQSLGRPGDPQEVFTCAESAPLQWSCLQEQLPSRYLPQAWGKSEYEQEVCSVSESSLTEWKHFEEQLPSRCPYQAEGGAEFQPQIFSTGSVSVPAEWGRVEGYLPPRHPYQAFANPECQQQVYSSSVSVAAKGTVFESNPSTWSLPRGPASPKKASIHIQGSEDLLKNIPTPATKTVKFAVAPAWPTSTSGDIYSKEEVLESSDPNIGSSDLPANEAVVENPFGIRLRRTPSSQNYKDNEESHFTMLPSPSVGPISSSVAREPESTSAFQGLLGITENLTTKSDFPEKQESKPQSDMSMQHPASKISGKVPGQQPDYATSEPAWIAMVKEKRKNFPTQIAMKELKTKKRAEAKTETKVPGYEGAGLPSENQQRKTSTSNVDREEMTAQMKLTKSTKAVGFETEKTFQVPAMGKETRPSSTHQVMFQEPTEPVWFSMAKKKAKAWSHISESMQ